MGTRGTYGFRIGGQDKLAYNHYDSCPDWLGRNLIEFIRSTSTDGMRKIAQGLILVDEDSTPTPEQIEKCNQWTDLKVSSQSTKDWYCLLREAQGNPDAWKQGLRFVIDSHEFMGDSLFCEWAYVINLDEETLEIYKGCNENPNAPGRYTSRGHYKAHDRTVFYGVALIRTIPLTEIQAMSDEEIQSLVDELEHSRIEVKV
jgi:hypothetical protein